MAVSGPTLTMNIPTKRLPVTAGRQQRVHHRWERNAPYYKVGNLYALSRENPYTERHPAAHVIRKIFFYAAASTKLFGNIAKGRGIERRDLMERVEEKYGVRRIEDLNVRQASSLIESLKAS